MDVLSHLQVGVQVGDPHVTLSDGPAGSVGGSDNEVPITR